MMRNKLLIVMYKNDVTLFNELGINRYQHHAPLCKHYRKNSALKSFGKYFNIFFFQLCMRPLDFPLRVNCT